MQSKYVVFDKVNVPFLDGDVTRRASYDAYILQLIRFARVCNHVADLNAQNKCLTAKLLKQGYRYHKPQKLLCKLLGAQGSPSSSSLLNLLNPRF